MLLIRKSEDRGLADHGWLKSWHSFSFAEYYDARHMGFRKLRVINQDIVAPGEGFPSHGHRDMEIITIVLRGTIEHKDSMGNKEHISRGEIQRMSAGTGITHSEFNPSPNEELELLQIWIEPESRGITPSYEQAKYEMPDREKLRLIVAPPNKLAAVHIHQDVYIYRGELKADDQLTLPLSEHRYGWLQLVKGKLTVSGIELTPGDALAITREAKLGIRAGKEATEFFLFDLA